MSGSKRDIVCLQDVFQEFTMEAKVPDAATLNKFINKYPHYAKELAAFTTEWIMQECIPKEETVEEIAGSEIEISKAMSFLQNKLYELDQEKASKNNESKLTNPFKDCDFSKIRDELVKLDIEETIFAKMRDRKILVETVPTYLLNKLADLLKVNTSELNQHLSMPAVIPSYAQFKSKTKPTALQKETFRSAIKNSLLSDSQKEKWFSTLK